MAVQTGPKTDIGKFRTSLNVITPNIKNPKLSNVPPKLRSLYNWYHSMDTREINSLIELQNVYTLMKDGILEQIADKLIHGESLSKKDLDFLRLIKETIVDYHKLRYGDKHTVEHKVDVKDLRNAMFASKINPHKVVEVDADGKISQGMDRTGCGESTSPFRKDEQTDEDSTGSG